MGGPKVCPLEKANILNPLAEPWNIRDFFEGNSTLGLTLTEEQTFFTVCPDAEVRTRQAQVVLKLVATVLTIRLLALHHQVQVVVTVVLTSEYCDIYRVTLCPIRWTSLDVPLGSRLDIIFWVAVVLDQLP